MDKRDFLFRFVSPAHRSRLKLDEEAFYSTTDQLTANKIARVLQRVLPDAVVTDATACVGGATLAFAAVFPRVHAIELDEVRYSYLRHNTSVLGISDKVSCIWGDALQVCAKLHQDIIFLDPPWGGPEYKSMERVSLTLSGRDLGDVCRALAPAAKYIAIKVPTNFDEDAFLRSVSGHANLVVKETQLRKMHLLVLETLA
jgi:predicted RNA methylase